MRVMVTAWIVVVLSLACNSEPLPAPLVSPSQVGIEGDYVISRCNFGPPAPPCITYVSGISSHRLDSARVVFNRDGSATWMAATRSQLCDIGRPCVSSASLEQHSATYKLLSNKVELVKVNAGQEALLVEFNVRIPASVPTMWPGPDTLQFGIESGLSHSVTLGKVQ